MFVDGLRELCTKATGAVQIPGVKSTKAVNNKSDPSTLVVIFMAFLCAVLPLDISQLAFAIIGAVFYAVLQKYDRPSAKKHQRVSVVVETAAQSVGPRALKPKVQPSRPTNSSHVKPTPASAPAPVAKPEVRATSVQPIAAPTFQSKGWEGEIQELLLQIAPTPEGDQIVSQLARLMQHVLKTSVPEIEVNGFASGNFANGKAFGVAVPEVDIIARASPQALFSRLHSRSAQGSPAQLDAKKMQKCAIRAFTDRLVAAGGFKFRRSAFRGQEPKVTLLAPASLGLFSESIPIDFSVNVVTPLYNAALLAECGNIDSRAKELILLVKRWAKDRGICHAAKGHLSPYLWGLLTIYYLQVGDKDEVPLLPPLDQFEMCARLLGRPRSQKATEQQKWKPAETTDSKKSVGSLFKDFVNFFECTFDWRNEAISIRAGRREPPSLDLPLHIIVEGDNTTSQVGPSIEDPFHSAQNLGDGMNAVSFARLKEELSRAKALCLSGASLSELLEPWAPPAEETGENNQDDEQANGSEEPAQSAPVSGKVAPTKMVAAPVKGDDWRRDAAEAQALKAPRSSTPPWRRSGAVAA